MYNWAVAVFVGDVFDLDVLARGINEFEFALDDHIVLSVQETFLQGFDVVA